MFFYDLLLCISIENNIIERVLFDNVSSSGKHLRRGICILGIININKRRMKNMKLFKSVTAIALSFTMVMGLAACGGGDSTTTPAEDSTGETPSAEVKTYKIATDTTFAPFEFEDEDRKSVV